MADKKPKKTIKGLMSRRDNTSDPKKEQKKKVTRTRTPNAAEGDKGTLVKNICNSCQKTHSGRCTS